jgi:hypothetical protein
MRGRRMTDTIPDDEVLIEAARRSGISGESLIDLRFYYRNGGAFRALADALVELGWKPPVDRKLLCAREANASMASSRKARAIYHEGVEDNSEAVKRCVRAIELWEEGFGK